ncbi:cellulose biosynthesis protein BcsG [Candidatus Nitrotoga sp. 1052]|uniref:cellulose biosynthesis protein BcsG n=1 Tax=Candidatus Nitrotoga sp. 1052 TaxID=2886964 RepID=UPI001EF6ABC4|nr:cellulose biosynthesis protein BcsG [Candidatus Nitrotoga sp. 1052]CAH1091802.1 Cellulose synthase operon protein YhjU [Candidatus Nitrotoga sp. 1052]
MGYWSIYFIAKLGLFYSGFIGFHWLPNLIFAVTLVLPLASNRHRLIRTVLAMPVGLALLYHDSWLPPISRVLSQKEALTGFGNDYLLELLGRFVNLWILAALGLLLVVYLLLRRRLRFATLAFLGILSAPIVSLQGGNIVQIVSPRPALAGVSATVSPDKQEPTAQLEAFYAAEQGKRVSFPSIADSAVPFDVVFLHVCSLSWDDMDYVGESNVTLLNHFDVVFRRFNSAASYSGPGALRLFRSNCGQLSHSKMYEGDASQCNLFRNFEAAGFEVRGLLNHDGHFDQFASLVQGLSGIGVKLDDNRFAPVSMRSFDDTPIYEDFPLLSEWWKHQQPSGRPRALYYNTTTLHDGNRIPGVKSRSSLETFKPRLDKLMSDFDRFITFLEDRGRPVVVILVPEHGAALRGDKVQISGMREIPNPKITLVPAAIKLIGFKGKSGDAPRQPLQVVKPVSYFAISTLLADFIADSPFTGTGGKPLAERVQNLLDTPFVSENEDIVVMGRENGYLMRSEGTWVDYQPGL